MDLIEWLVGSAETVTDPGFIARVVVLVVCVQLMGAVASVISKGTR